MLHLNGWLASNKLNKLIVLRLLHIIKLSTTKVITSKWLIQATKGSRRAKLGEDLTYWFNII